MPKATFIPKGDVKKGHKTVLGTVTTDPEVSPSGKTMLITVKTHSGVEFTDRMSTVGKMAIFTEDAAV